MNSRGVISALYLRSSGPAGGEPAQPLPRQRRRRPYDFLPAAGTNYSVNRELILAARLDALGRALQAQLTGISGYRTRSARSRWEDLPMTIASDTPGVEGVSAATLAQFCLTRPFGGPGKPTRSRSPSMTDASRSIGPGPRCAAPAQAPPPRFPWADEAAVSGIVAQAGGEVSFTEEQLNVTESSPEAYHDKVQAAHPMSVATCPLLEQAGTYDDVRAQMISALAAHNEDPSGLRLTSRYVIAEIRPTSAA